MAEHRDLTGAALHEPKGIELATANTVYIANGSGSGAWQDRLSGVNNLNKFSMHGVITDVSTAGRNAYFYIPWDCTLDRLSIIVDGTMTTANAVVSLYRDGVLLPNTVTLLYSTSGAGVLTTMAFSPAISFTAGQRLEIRTDGGSDTAVAGHATLVFTAV